MRKIPIALCSVLLLSCASDEPDVASTSRESGPPIDPRRSLAVTEEAIMDFFPLEKVLAQLVLQSQAPTTPLELYQQWFDTMDTAPGVTIGPHCDDETTGGLPSFNGFPWMCPRVERVQAGEDPFIDPNADEAYVAIGLFNRFDLAPVDGRNCGEYRIVYARRSGINQLFTRNLLIFEAVLPNPDPDCGLEACRPVAEFWANLSAEDDVVTRGKLLHDFYFNGLPGFAPVIHVNHYGANITGTGYGQTSGQIRTNSFMQSPWMLREFRLVNDCRSGCEGDTTADTALPTCRLVMLPATVKTNPFGRLFDSVFPDGRQDLYQSFFQSQVVNLAIADINRFFHEVPDEFNAGQSLSQGIENDYAVQMDSVFEADVQATLNAHGLSLTPANIADRATAMSCGGCHQLSNSDDLGDGIIWPNSAGFVHVQEFGGTVPGPDGPRWDISSALTDVFLPHRQHVLEDFLNNGGGGCFSGSTTADPHIPVPPCVDSDSARAADVEAISAAEREEGGEDEKLGGSRTVH